jgi:hypothetical protein
LQDFSLWFLQFKNIQNYPHMLQFIVIFQITIPDIPLLGRFFDKNVWF